MLEIIQPKYPSHGSMCPRQLSQITDFIVHHTAGNVDQTPLEIDAEHRAIGDAMIGYNYIIAKDGKVYAGRPIEFLPAASFGRNTESLNVSLVGNFEKGDQGFTGAPTAEQVKALKELCLYAHTLVPSIVRTIGHRDVAEMFYPPSKWGDYSTACPGSELYKLLPEVRKYVADNYHAKK